MQVLLSILEINLIIILIIVLVIVLFFLIYSIKNKTHINQLTKLSEDKTINEKEKLIELDSLKTKIIDELDKRIENLTEKMNRNDKESLTDLNSFKTDILEKITKEITFLREKVDFEIKEGLNQTNNSVVTLTKQMSKIDNAKEEITNLSKGLIELNHILKDKTQRGLFGETILSQVLFNVYGDNSKLYQLQYKIDNVRGDAVIFAPQPVGLIFIDSKFPLENYSRSKDLNNDENSRTFASKQFVLDVKKHIEDVSTKYIIPNITASQAIMFIPSEAVFIEIVNNHMELVLYSEKMNVCLCSPSTLIAVMTITLSLINQIEREKNLELILEDIDKINNYFIDFKLKFEKITTLSTQLNDTIQEESRKILILDKSIEKLEKEKKKKTYYKEIKNSDKIE